MEEEEEVVYIKIFDKEKGDVVFEGKVSTDVEPGELVHLRCFWERRLGAIYNKVTKERVTNVKGLQNNVELVARSRGGYLDFSGVLYVGAEDKVLRKSNSVPLCECVKMSVCKLSQEECEKAFKCETLEELEIFDCKLRRMPTDIGKVKKLKKVTLCGLYELMRISEIGELSNLEELWIIRCGIERLPKRLKDLKMLKWISLVGLFKLLLNSEDLVVFSKLKHLAIWSCYKAFTPPFTKSFWEMIQSTTDLRVLDLFWNDQNQELVGGALEENGSIDDGGEEYEEYAHFFKRNKENHERALQCVVHLLAIRRWRDVLNGVPKEMVRMIAMMLWMMKCDVKTWTKK